MLGRKSSCPNTPHLISIVAIGVQPEPEVASSSRIINSKERHYSSAILVL